MSKFRYKFKIAQILLREAHLSDDFKSLIKDKEIMSLIQEIVGTPIIIITEDDDDFPYSGYWTAKNSAERKAAEVVAGLLGTDYGGSTYDSTFDKSADVKGKITECKLESIEQVE